MELESLNKLFIHELKDLHSAENQILDALPQMIEKTKNDKLRNALQEHLEETRGQVDRLDQIFDHLDEKPGGQHCKGMEGLIAEGEEILKEKADESVRDAGIIAAAQRVEHYEMAAYGTAATYAEMLNDMKALELLRQTLDQEKNADRRLSEIAKQTVNVKAREA